jgi:REP element-mobilizing transposase RayT
MLVLHDQFLERRKILLVDHIDALRAAAMKTRECYPFVIDAVVVLPDHIQAVWTRCRRAMPIFHSCVERVAIH